MTNFYHKNISFSKAKRYYNPLPKLKNHCLFLRKVEIFMHR